MGKKSPITTGSLNRVDGVQKVTGVAKYSAEYHFPGLVYGALAYSTITKGSITAIDTKVAEKAPGVLSVITHLNCPELPGYKSAGAQVNVPASNRGYYVFADNRVHFNGQPIALVIADTYENAVYAASRIKATYKKQKSNTDLDTAIKTGKPLKGDNYKPYVRGEAGAWKKAAIKIEAEYSIPVEVNNPMEMHGITVVWEAEKKVTVYEKTQTLQDSQKNIMNIFGLKEEDVRVITKFVGGGFGSASNTWPHSIAALIGGRKIGRPLKLVLNRGQMFNTVGYRPQSKQKIGIGAGADGKLFGITHKAMATTSSYGAFPEKFVNGTRSCYSCANVNTSYTVYPLDLSLPTTMRGPGFTSGVFALESAMDELAHSLHLDPVEFRLRNYTDTDPYNNNLPFSCKFLKEAYKAGAEKINWQDRNPQPRSMKQGDWLIGYGMAGAMYPATRDDSPTASVAATFFADGSLILRCAVTDMGPGTATSMTKLASDILGLPPGNIKFELGDTDFPPGFRQGGSVTTSALGTAVYNVCANLKEKIGALIESDSIFKAIKPEGLLFEGGFIKLVSDHSKKISYTDVTKQAGIKQLKSLEVSEKNILQGYSAFSFAAHFVKLMVNARTGVVKIMNVVCAVDGGKIVNEETARSQIIGSVAGGIGMALFEGGVIDHRYGRWVNNSLGDYHVAVNADVPHIDVLFVNKPDPVLNPIGSKGIGEVGIVGFAAAVANAVHHATGKRIRELPITIDKLI